jgi:flagellum-specific peptidoglycan hydrolase FlgJ
VVNNIGFKRSPNYTQGRSVWDKRADIIVHHVTEGSFDGAVSWLTNTESKVSSHFVTAQDGRYIQLVQLQDMAWCNGNGPSTINEATNKTVLSRPATNANLYTFSIENEGFSYKQNYGVPTPTQREAIQEVHKTIVDYILSYNPEWRANKDNIIGHCHIRSKHKPACPSPNFGEKFPFDELVTEINQYIDSKQKEAGSKEPIKKPVDVSVIESLINQHDYMKWPGITRHNGMNGYQIPFVLDIAPAIQATMDCGILCSVRIAQAILETEWGQSKLARVANNLFGIKADRNWTGAIYDTSTNDWYPEIGTQIAQSDFRAYADWNESILDHAGFLKSNKRYASIIGDKDYKSVASKLRAAGYATSPTYPELLVSIIKSNHLEWFDSLPPLKIDKVIPVEEKNKPTDTVSAIGIQIGTMVKVRPGSQSYNGISVASFVFNNTYPVSSFSGERVVLDKTGINTAFHVNDLIIVENKK